MDDTDVVVLLDEHDQPIGTAPRTTVHDHDTPLHLAFSCYLFDETGRLLLTRRAVGKKTWPGVWTNSFCGHPRPGESHEEAIHRYADRELGTTIGDLRPLLPDFRYRAVDASGVVENEVCPVFAATCAGDLRPDRDEVEEWRWVTQEDLAATVAVAPWALSPWLLEQHADLVRTGQWPVVSE